MLVYCLFLHLVADFFLQSREMGTKKSSEFAWLAMHLAIQFLMFQVGLGFIVGFGVATKFALLNALIHGVIDWNIWKLYKYSAYVRLADQARQEGCRKDQIEDRVKELSKGWKYYEDHLFYSTIGVDQFLHAATLVLLFGALL